MREKHSLQDRVEMLGAVPHARVRSVLISGHIFLNRYLLMEVLIQIYLFSVQLWGEEFYFDLVTRRIYSKLWFVKFKISVHLIVGCSQLQIWQYILLVKPNNCRQ